MISVGVPTVVDVQTLAGDLLGEVGEKELPKLAKSMVVIPREIDLLTERASRLLGFALNAALQERFELKELVELM